MRALIAFLTSWWLLTAAQAQAASVADLLQAGYELKSAYSVASYSDTAVLYFQRDNSLYVCVVRGQSSGQLTGAQVAGGQCEPVQ